MPPISRKKAAPPRTYQLKVTLMEADPAIWRRVVVPGDTTLGRLDWISEVAREEGEAFVYDEYESTRTWIE